MMTINTRRNFLKAGFLSTGIVVMSGCEIFTIVTVSDTISVVQNDLFPKAKELHIDTAKYMSLFFEHSKISDKDKVFLKDGVKWLNEAAVEKYKKIYAKLSQRQRQEVLQTISQTSWGKRWIRAMLTYVFEAMFSDPIYGSNKNEAGWKWLHFNGGLPRAKEVYI